MKENEQAIKSRARKWYLCQIEITWLLKHWYDHLLRHPRLNIFAFAYFDVSRVWWKSLHPVKEKTSSVHVHEWIFDLSFIKSIQESLGDKEIYSRQGMEKTQAHYMILNDSRWKERGKNMWKKKERSSPGQWPRVSQWIYERKHEKNGEINITAHRYLSIQG